MTVPDTWHADRDLLHRYADGRLDPAVAWSLEQHVTACPRCRSEVARTDGRPVVAATRLDAIWAQVEAVVDVPTPTPVERLLRWVGVPDHVARLLAATPSLTVPWLVAVAFVLAVAAGIARLSDAGPLPFLTLAPLVPLAGVAIAFGRWSDPTHDIALAAPIRSGRLVLVRAAAVTATSFVLAAAAALLLPGLGWMTAAWAVPGLAVTATMLALSTWWSPVTSSAVVGTGWVAVVLVAEAVTGASLASFTTTGQLLAAGTGVLATWVASVRRETLEQGRIA